MPGLRIYKNGFHSNIGANQPIMSGTINIGCTRGRGSTKRTINFSNGVSNGTFSIPNGTYTITSNAQYNTIITFKSNSSITFYRNYNVNYIKMLNLIPKYILCIRSRDA